MYYITYRFGLHNIISSGFITDDEASDSDSLDSSDSGGARRMKKRRPIASPTDYKLKKDTAEDFFDIDELAEESPNEKIAIKDDYDIEDAIPAAKVSADFSKDSKIKIEKNDDKDLMPPPPLDAAPSIKQDESSTTDGNDSSDGNESRKSEKKLDTPLGLCIYLIPFMTDS